MNGVLAQLVNTPEIEGINYIDCTIIRVDTDLNLNYQLNYDDLSESEKKTIDDFISLVISKSPSQT